MNDRYLKILTENFELAMEMLLEGTKRALREQGFYNTGRSEEEMRVDIERVSKNKFLGSIIVPGHIMIWDKGIKKTKVPFSKPSGRGGKSKYITGLIEYFMSKGLGFKESKSRAFATAYKARYKTGHPSIPYAGGKSFSSTGKRKGWTKVAYKKSEVRKALKILGFNRVVRDITTELTKAA